MKELVIRVQVLSGDSSERRILHLRFLILTLLRFAGFEVEGLDNIEIDTWDVV